MIRFLIHKPVSVLMTFLAMVMLAVFSIRQISITLLPDIDIPTISVIAQYPDHSAMEVEQAVMAPLRQGIQQVGGVDRLESRASDEQGRLTVHFPYRKDIDLAFIEVNEKLDLSLNALPQGLARPVVVKTKASDLPAIYLTIRYKDSLQTGSLMDLSEFTSRSVRRRLEQLPSVAMADLTGGISSHITIQPRMNMLQSLGITHQDIQAAIQRANLTLGNIMVRERQYEYRIRIGQPMQSLDDLRNTPLKIGDQVFRIRDLAEVALVQTEPQGRFLDHTMPAFNLALFKDYSARMRTFEEEVRTTIEELQETHPELVFHLNRNQARLLDLSIHDMETTLWLGCLLATLIVFFFYRDYRIPIVVGIVTPLSLAISILFLYLAGLSVNIVSLSGIILGIGMMIDNGIIILDNIVQESVRGTSTEEACIQGTNEMILPLLASMLTTCAVFLPLIFLSDMAGALFFDQAVAVSICLGVSYLVSIVFIPVMYFRLFRNRPVRVGKEGHRHHWIRKAYDAGFHFTFDRGAWILVVVSMVLVGGYIAASKMPKETMPQLPRTSFQIQIEWNETIPLNRMVENVRDLRHWLGQEVRDFQAYLGPQQFIFNDHYRLDGESANIYLSFEDSEQEEVVQNRVQGWFDMRAPKADITFLPDRDLFEIIFPSNVPDDYVAFYHNALTDEEAMQAHRSLKTDWAQNHGVWILNDPPATEVVILKTNDQRMMRYGIDKNYALEVVAHHLQELQIAELAQLDRDVPIVLTSDACGLDRLFTDIQIVNMEKQVFPLDQFFYTSTGQRMKYVHADQRGPFIPEVIRPGEVKAVPAAIAARKQHFPTENFRLVSPREDSRAMISEMSLALLVSVLLLYLIVAAQFESLLTPLIILLEIPISVSGAIVALWCLGISLNAMALIGMVVTTGIIINDSIIKIDTINRLHRGGMSLREAIHTGGQKRLFPILMTSMTTVLAVLPYMIGNSIGVVLQRPLSVSLIGSMVVGTLVSLFFIPKVYYWMNR